jgi:hypothetical protein
VLLVDDGSPRDVFELIELGDPIVQARSPFLFEVGEELKLRIERDGTSREVSVRVRSHRQDGVTELEIVG